MCVVSASLLDATGVTLALVIIEWSVWQELQYVQMNWPKHLQVLS